MSTPRFVRFLIRFYPRSFRARHGAELTDLYSRLYGGRGFRGVLRAVFDTLRDAPGAYLDTWRTSDRDDVARTESDPRARARGDGFLPSALEIRQATRSLARRPAFSLIIVATLALGIGANTAIFSVVNGVLLAPLPFPEPDRLVRLWGTENGEPKVGGTLAYLDVVDFADASRTLGAVAAYDEWTVNLTGSGDPIRLDAALVSANYFDVLGARPATGRFFVAEEDIDGKDRVVVLEHGFWQRHFGGDPSVVGRALTLNDRPHVVIGVARADFEDPDLGDDDRPPAMWRPLGFVGVAEDQMPNRGSESFVAIARLADGLELAAAQSEIDALASRLEATHPVSNEGRGVLLVPLLDQLVDDSDASILLLLGAVGFLLAIATANVASMMIGRAAERAGEASLRAALGASRRALLRFGMLEGLLLALLGGALGVGLAHALCRLVVSAGATSLPRADRVGIDGRVLLFAVAVSLAVGILSGILPALRHARAGDRMPGGQRRNQHLGGATSGAGVLRLRGTLVVVELSMALVLLYGAALLGASLLELTRTEVGVDARNLLTFDLAPPFAKLREIEDQNAFYGAVLEGLAAIPGVAAASSTNILPLSGSFDGNALGIPHDRAPSAEGTWSAQTRAVSPAFFETAGIPVLRGRGFDATDRPESSPVAVVNRALAERFWPDGDALGARIEISERAVEVVGIVGDTKHLDLREGVVWHVYLPRTQGTMWWLGVRQSILVRMQPGHGLDPGLAESIRRAVWAVDPEIPVANLRSMQQIVDRTTHEPRLRAALIVTFAAVAVMLAGLGIYGVASYSIALERRALAVRMALGARRIDIAWLVLGRIAAWTAIGAGLGTAGAWGLGRVLRGLVDGVGALGATPLVLVPALALVALVAAWTPARRALRIEPAATLRSE